MRPAIASEFRKLLTVRSTYFVLLISMAMVVLFAGIAGGLKIDKLSLADPHYLQTQATSAIVFTGFITAFVGLLLAGHEYRYNTIMYTLTASNRRWKVLTAKVFVISVFTLLASLFIMFFSPLCSIIGVHLKGGPQLVPQNFAYSTVIWHCLYVGWGYAMYALILLLILRNQVGAIVTFLLVPLIGENIMMLLLKGNGKYLPFSSLQQVASQSSDRLPGVSAGFGLKVSLVYIVVGLAVSTLLFVKRDAN